MKCSSADENFMEKLVCPNLHSHDILADKNFMELKRVCAMVPTTECINIPSQLCDEVVEELCEDKCTPVWWCKVC